MSYAVFFCSHPALFVVRNDEMRSTKVKNLIDVCVCGPLKEIENPSPLFETSLAHLRHALVAWARLKDWLRWLKWSLRHWLRLSGASSVIEKMDVGD